MRGSVIVAFVSALVVRGGLGCDEDRPTCYQGDYLGCTCADGAAGYAQCTPAGEYAACVCDGTTPGVDGGAPDAADADASSGACSGADGGDAGSKAYAEPCTSDAECASCRCETFGQERACTTSCATVEDCPTPAFACTNRGVCRPTP